MEKQVKQVIKQIEKSPMGDDDIRQYLPDAKIIKYSQLKRYKSIEELLPKSTDYVIILVESSLNTGHWITVLRYDDKIEHFDSYGNHPSTPLKWISPNLREQLGMKTDYLDRLYDNTVKEVIYNPIDYQKDSKDINTCGRFVVSRILMLLNHNMDLYEYYDFMKNLKNKSKLTYDSIVSANITE